MHKYEYIYTWHNCKSVCVCVCVHFSPREQCREGDCNKRRWPGAEYRNGGWTCRWQTTCCCIQALGCSNLFHMNTASLLEYTCMSMSTHRHTRVSHSTLIKKRYFSESLIKYYGACNILMTLNQGNLTTILTPQSNKVKTFFSSFELTPLAMSYIFFAPWRCL